MPQSLLWAGAFSPCARPALVDAVLLNNIVQNFGMLDLVKKVLASHKCQMDRSREQYARDLAGTLALRGVGDPEMTPARLPVNSPSAPRFACEVAPSWGGACGHA